MKKVVLCAIALAFGTVAFAQVSTSSGTAPDASTVVPNLSADPTANVGQSVQNGDDQKVKVRQAGTSQSVYTEQDNGSMAGRNLAYVRQTGAVSAASGVANRAETRQSGEDNQSTTLQEGDYNNALTRQGQNDASSARNKARIRQGVADQAENNYAAIEQDGDDNLANTRQTWDNSDAWTRQIGDDNKSMIVQNASPEDSDGHMAMNYQEGESNQSSIDQRGNGGRNVALAQQRGDDNFAKQIQNTSAHAGESGNSGYVLQGLNGPITDADFPNEVNTFFDMDANVDDYVFDGSTGSGSTESFGGIAFQIQYGEDNSATSLQVGGEDFDSNYSKQVQYWGSGNSAGVFQNRAGGLGGANEADQRQGGHDNTAGIAQNGTGQRALQTQYGNDNSALTVQQGADHLLNIHQRGDDNAATSAQRGVANRALIVQRDGQSFIAQQNLDGLGGGGNQIDALQLGPDGDFHDDAIDCYFNEQMDPWMDFSVPDLEIGDICVDC